MKEGTRDIGRFWVLRAAMVAACLVLILRIVQVQVFQHDRYRPMAEDQWSRMVPVNAERGNLYDRQGRALALSVTTWRVGVAGSLVDAPDSLVAVLARILDRKPQSLRRQLKKAADHHVVLGREVILTRQQKQRLQREKAVTLEDLRSRVYPHDGVGASVIGFYNHGSGDGIATGLEYSLGGYLAGRQGRARQIATAVPGRNLGKVVVQEATHGQNLALTLDTELQSICEIQLQRSVQECGADGGSVLILEPNSGDILAAASWPLLTTRQGRHDDDAVWNNRNFTQQYEPGSVFKIFSTASLLRNAAIDTATVYDCTNGDFGSFTIRNSDGHSYGDLSLMPAFSRSSNIYFARAVQNLSAEELYRDLVDFGFGQSAALPYPGLVAGILKPPAMWSGRSKPTIAIGQEVAVTPLQLGLAVCAVANGGTLFAPRLVRAIGDDYGQILDEVAPVPLRRVIAEPLAELLREAMGRVVREGTGIGAAMEWISAGGKTGTAQKSRDGRGYTPGAYVATFAGMVPLEDPRLVILTILDEPVGSRHYAAQSAVPLFREVVADIRQSTDWLTDVPGARTALLPAPEDVEQADVPDVLYLSVPNAAQRLGAAGFRPAGTERDGVVVQQIPAAGTHYQVGEVVALTVAGRDTPRAAAEILCPDFAGLSNRQVRSLAARLGVEVAIDGVGYVSRQQPAAGQRIAGLPVRVTMETTWR